MPLAEDQHVIQALAPTPHEPFSIGVRPRTPRWDFTTSIPRWHRVECLSELPGLVPDQEPESGSPLPQVHQQVPRLLHRPRAVRVRGHAEDIYISGANPRGRRTHTPGAG